MCLFFSERIFLLGHHVIFQHIFSHIHVFLLSQSPWDAVSSMNLQTVSQSNFFFSLRELTDPMIALLKQTKTDNYRYPLWVPVSYIMLNSHNIFLLYFYSQNLVEFHYGKWMYFEYIQLF